MIVRELEDGTGFLCFVFAAAEIVPLFIVCIRGFLRGIGLITVFGFTILLI